MKTCVSCKREFNPSSRHKKCPKCRKKFHKCLDCTNLINIERKRCLTCSNRFNTKRGPDNPLFKRKRLTKRGYVLIWCPTHPKVQNRKSCHRYLYEHMLVMEAYLGRHLLPGENVHHKNGVKNDNRIENLELWTRPQPSGIRVSDAINHAISILQNYAPQILKE